MSAPKHSGSVRAARDRFDVVRAFDRCLGFDSSVFFRLSHDFLAPCRSSSGLRGCCRSPPPSPLARKLESSLGPQQTTFYNVAIDRMPAWMASRQEAGPSSRNGFVENHDFGKKECRASHEFETAP
jgi:hypothetical protein